MQLSLIKMPVGSRFPEKAVRILLDIEDFVDTIDMRSLTRIEFNAIRHC